MYKILILQFNLSHPVFVDSSIKQKDLFFTHKSYSEMREWIHSKTRSIFVNTSWKKFFHPKFKQQNLDWNVKLDLFSEMNEYWCSCPIDTNGCPILVDRNRVRFGWRRHKNALTAHFPYSNSIWTNKSEPFFENNCIMLYSINKIQSVILRVDWQRDAKNTFSQQ